MIYSQQYADYFEIISPSVHNLQTLCYTIYKRLWPNTRNDLKCCLRYTVYCGEGEWIEYCAVKEWSVYCVGWNGPLIVATVIVLAGEEMALGRPTSSLGWRLLFQNVEQRPRVSLQQYMYRTTVQNVLLWNTAKYSFRHPQYCFYVMCNCQCNCQYKFHCNFNYFWSLQHSVLKITAVRTPHYNVTVPRSEVVYIKKQIFKFSIKQLPVI